MFMVDKQNLQLKNLEKERANQEETEGIKEIEKSVLLPEKERMLKIQPEERQKILDEIGRFGSNDTGVTSALSDEGVKSREQEKKIEKILETGLTDIYLSLRPDKQEEFRREGEKTAQKINSLLNKAKINLGKIINLIKKWLAIIPGVNRFFLEQEAKIKADEMIKLKE